MPILINTSIFAHILLDSELSGRFGVQGNTFKNTFGYLNQYFKKLPNIPLSVQKIAAAMNALVIRENDIDALYDIKKLDAFTLKTQQEIELLQPDQNILVPGGWQGIDSPGHAMIYQFEKDKNGDLLFSIYNSGGGIQYHEKTSSTKKELYSPVKTYKFPKPIDQTELRQLIKRITVPQLAAGHPARNHRKFNDEEMYTNIETSLEFMKAEHIEENLGTSYVTTGSQLSGTCAQRSIHQLLKVNFSSLPEYQRFIFDFKMYALKDFIQTHPKPRSPEITLLIQKAIINNLRILEEPGVFNDKNEQEGTVKVLEDLKQQLMSEIPFSSSFWLQGIDFSSFWHFTSVIQNFINTVFATTDRLTAKIAPFEMSTVSEPQPWQPLVSTLHKDHLLSDLELVIERCTAQETQNPAWVMTQIEQTVLSLPIPSTSALAPPYYEKLSFYNAIKTPDDFENIAQTLDKLQRLYRHASEKLMQNTTVPTQVVTYCSLFALRDYFDAIGEAVTGIPTFHSFLHTILFKYLNSFKSYPFLATNNPHADRRLEDLLTLTHHTRVKQVWPNVFGDEDAFLSILEADPYLKTYLESKDNPEKKKDETLTKRYQDIIHDDNALFVNFRHWYGAQKHAAGNKHIPNPIGYYQLLLDSEPNLKAQLEAIFELRQYGDDYLYDGLRREKLTALYILLNDLDEHGYLISESSLSEEVFKPLLKKIQHLRTLEKVFVEYLEPLQSVEQGKIFSCLLYGRSEDNREIGSKQTIKSSSPYYEWADNVINIKYCNYKLPLRPQDKASITHHKYCFTDSLAYSALLQSDAYYKSGAWFRTIQDAKTINEIQLFPPDKENRTGMMNKAHYFGRDLFHLRKSSLHQITLTLDYFSRSETIGKLQDGNIQSYVEANLFEPGLLLDTLKNDTTFWVRFNAFIEKGLEHFSSSDGLLTPEALFFIRLKMQVYHYVALNSPAAESMRLLQENQAELNKLIGVEKDAAGLACLHALRYSNAISLYQQGDSNEQLLEEALFSYFHKNATYNPFIPQDTSTRFEQTRSDVYFIEYLRATPAFIQPLITPIMAKLNLEVNHLSISGEYPIFHYQDEAGTTIYSVNVEQGRIFQDHFSFGAIPLDLKHHPIIHRLGLQQETSCWISEDGNLIRFKSGNVRMKRESDRLIVQKKWNNAWYQLTPLSDKQQIFFGLDTASVPANKLPSNLIDGSVDAWVNEQQALIVRHNKPIYQVDKNGIFHQLDEDGHLNGCIRVKAPHISEKVLAQFESPDFFNVNLDEDTESQGTVDFVRFGLTLKIADNQVSLPGTSYRLTETSPLAPHIAALTFTNGTNEQCIVAVHPFYVDEATPQTTGHYYQLTHDNSGYIPNKVLAEGGGEQKIPIWHHPNSQRTITYKVVDGKLKPETAADALYLCYLYLASHETDKAWGVLADLSKTLSFVGSIDELRYLSWIIEALPTVLDKEKDKERQLEIPEYVSCQLKALALYADFLKLGKAPDIGVDKPIVGVYANEMYEQKCLEHLSSFQQNLDDTISKLYSRYQRQERHLYEQYKLGDDESKALLNFCSSITHGALGYEKRRLSLKKLLKEYQRLVAVWDTSSDFPPNFEKRLANIEKQITHELKVKKRRTQLEWSELDLEFHGPLEPATDSFPPILNEIEEKVLSPDAKKSLEEWRYNVFMSPLDLQAALDTLHSGIHQDDFMRYFPTYLHIACSGSLEHRALLKIFCTHYLVGFRHAHSTTSEGNIRHLSNVLYHVLENPEMFLSSEEEVSLNELRNMAKNCDVTPIPFAKPRDVYDEILASNQDIWDSLKEEFPAHQAMPPLEAICIEPLWRLLGMQGSLQAYHDEEHAYIRRMQEVQNEQIAGQLQFDCLQRQRTIAEEVFQYTGVQESLAQRATTLEIKQQKDLADIWEDALKQANKATKGTISVIAEQRHILTQEELLSLYLHADLTLYIEKTGLTKEDCLKLHERIHEGVSLEVQHQQVNRLLAALKTGAPHQIATVLMAENTPQAQTDSGLMLFQYAEDILVRPRQIEALTSLLSTPDSPHHFNHVVEKVIMGGGKSKVILPMMAEKKATGLNLVVVEVPRALLATNHVDLNTTSQRLFGQKAHRFEFNRESNCSAERLQTIYETFVEIMTDKAYLVTTGEAMQSLELKYLELLFSRPAEQAKLEEWQKQIYWLSKITGLIKSVGDVVIDEVHQGLLLKKKLNYTLGDFDAIPPSWIKQSVELYQFVAVLQGQSLTSDILCSHPQSPLHGLMSDLERQNEGVDILGTLEGYFKNEDMPFIIENASPEIKETLAFYKEQLELLPRTQGRHYKEHYGPSQTQTTALKRALAIPYIASNRPNERSRFGNPLEMINYTIQGLLHDGLNGELLKTSILEWQLEARAELTSSKKYHVLDDTPTATRINTLLKDTGLTLGSIHLNTKQGEQSFLSYLEQLKLRKELIFSVLEEQILPQVASEPAVLHSDAYNHVDMYHTVQGLSGTPWNYSTYHQRLKFNPRTSLGTDGYIEAVLKEKQTQITAVPFESIDQFLASLFAKKPDTRALIDINATFAGFSNLEVAKNLAKKTMQFDPSIQYILYFNEHDVLCALNVKTQYSMVLATSNPDEINQKIGCTPDEFFTYYDQSHTVGTDIKQAATAHAFVLADNRIHLESFLQGCLRMRGIADEQTLDIIVPDDTPTSLDALIALMAQNEQDQLKEDNFFAVLAKMNNLIRQDFLQQLAHVPDEDVDKKHQLAQAFKHYFVETESNSLFEKYGGICKERLTQNLFQEHHKALMRDWEKCLLDAGVFSTEENKNTLNTALSAIIETAIPLCKEKTISRNHQQVLGMEVEHEQEVQQEVEKEKLEEAERFNSDLCAAVRHQWEDKERGSALVEFINKGGNEYMRPLNELSDAPYFSQNLLVDANYANVYKEQQKMLCQFLKPVMPILFRKSGDTITACLIDMDDLVELHALIKDEGDINIWISTTQHHILSGQLPEGIQQNQDYQALVEQIRFFNGELNGLREQEVPLRWLSESGDEKITYFYEHIMPYRQTVLSEVNNLRLSLSSKINAVAFSSKNEEKKSSIAATKQMKGMLPKPFTPEVESDSKSRTKNIH